MLLNASRRVRKGRPKNYIPEEDLRPLAASFLKGEPLEGELAVISLEQAVEADYNLSPSRWVGQAAGGAEADLSDVIKRLESVIAEEAAVSAGLQTALGRLRSLA